jgi:antitoxin HigA-1
MTEIPADRPPGMEPSHPGAIFREDVLPALALSASEAARQLGVSRRKLQSILDERSPLHSRDGRPARQVLQQRR